jgi:hypothetical protein
VCANSRVINRMCVRRKGGREGCLERRVGGWGGGSGGGKVAWRGGRQPKNAAIAKSWFPTHTHIHTHMYTHTHTLKNDNGTVRRYIFNIRIH